MLTGSTHATDWAGHAGSPERTCEDRLDCWNPTHDRVRCTQHVDHPQHHRLVCCHETRKGEIQGCPCTVFSVPGVYLMGDANLKSTRLLNKVEYKKIGSTSGRHIYITNAVQSLHAQSCMQY